MAGPVTEFRAGTRLHSVTCTTEVIVTKGGSGVLTCGGKPMTAEDVHANGARPGQPEEDRTLLGKRYRSPDGAFEALCVRQGTGALELDGVPLELVKPRTLPASD